VTLAPAGVTIVGRTQVTIKAPKVTLDTSMLQVTAPLSTFAGTTKADTSIATTMIAAAYMPGAGGLL